jgi:tripartite-type tricarboxylate transporter receptor subunit TctC
MNSRISRLLWLIVALIGGLSSLPPAFSQDFYKGKTITMYSGYVGGSVDNEMRLAARFLGKYIPGNPNITPMDMPGATGIVCANYLYNIAKPDGLTIGMPGRSAFILASITGDKNAKFDPSKFNYVGSSGPENEFLWLRKELNIRSVDELRKVKQPIVIGGTTGSSVTVVVPLIFSKYKELPLRVVPGYPGGAEVLLAIQRSELDGMYNLTATIPPDLISSGAIVPVIQALSIRSDLPTIDDVITNEQERAVMHLATAVDEIGAPLLGPPGVANDAMNILRNAYTEMVKSDEYRAAAAAQLINVSKPYSGDGLQKFVTSNLTGISPETVQEYLSIVGTK